MCVYTRPSSPFYIVRKVYTDLQCNSAFPPPVCFIRNERSSFQNPIPHLILFPRTVLGIQPMCRVVCSYSSQDVFNLPRIKKSKSANGQIRRRKRGVNVQYPPPFLASFQFSFIHPYTSPGFWLIFNFIYNFQVFSKSFAFLSA